jgi:peptide-methionine (S)-S-oxide reductase
MFPMNGPITAALWLLAGAALASPPAASGAPAPAPRPVVTARATFAGGCFWCMETAFEGIPGVISVTSGFSGGTERNPTYDQVSAGGTGHTESVQVVYDPKRISYRRLLEIFWRNIDPTQGDGQFCDRGKQYRSAIFFGSGEERRLALASARIAAAELRVKKRIVTEILPFTAFYPAEEYHQDYYKKKPASYHAYREGCGRDRRLRALWGKVPHTAG